MRFKQYLYESSIIGSIDESGAGMSRVLSILDKGKDFLFITSSRGDDSRNTVMSNNNKMLQDIRSEIGMKIGAYKIVGHWKECNHELKDGETIKDCDGDITNALEETWLIIKPDSVTSEEFNNIAMKMTRKYKQDAYVIRIDGKLEIRGKDGQSWGDLGKADKKSLSTGFNKIVNIQGYSELSKLRKKGRSQNIVFEDIYVVQPKNQNSSKMLFKAMNILY